MKKTKPINSRNKGKRGELEAAKILSAAGIKAYRSQQHKGRSDSADITTSADSMFYFEAKRRERISIYSTLKKAKDECEEKTPIVLYKKNREKWVTIMEFDSFVAILQMIMPWLIDDDENVNPETIAETISSTAYAVNLLTEPPCVVERSTGRVVLFISKDVSNNFLLQKEISECKTDAQVIQVITASRFSPVKIGGLTVYYPAK